MGIENYLEAMDMAPGDSCAGLELVDLDAIERKKQTHAPMEEIVALERALAFGANYLYFRRSDARPPVPVAYIYDRSERIADSLLAAPQAGHDARDPETALFELQRRLWCAGDVPLAFVFRPTEVVIFHVLKGPDAEHGRQNPFKTICLAEDAAQRLKEFSARQFDNGRFWEENPESRRLKVDDAAFMRLSRELDWCRRTLVHDHHADETVVRRLLIVFILVKYLEERRDREGRGVFPDGLFAQFATGAVGFVDLLRAGSDAVMAFLDHLAAKTRFNGDVFEFSTTEREKLVATDLSPFAELLDARTEGPQRTLWRNYAFDELPVELISHIYEQFLPRQPGVVYTPPFLVNFILDEVLPLSERTPDSFRLIDPACGSGVFLVGAFKRLVHRWRRANEYQRPDVSTLKQLLRDHIFGADLEGEAVRLTQFSLSVALCDFLEPRVIWDELHFDCLRDSNLFEGDFFALAGDRRWSEERGFDTVVGNPPFVSELTPAGRREVQAIQRVEPEFDLPDNQAALLFLKTALRIAKPGAQVALVQPSAPLLYGENSQRFRKPLLQKVHVWQVADLTHLSRVLFKRRVPGATGSPASNPGDVAVAVVFAENAPARLDEPLLHVTIRRTVQAEQKLAFEVDHYDLHLVPRRDAIRDPGIWKANFVGGGRIVHLLRRLSVLPSLGRFLEEKRRSGWDFGEGFTAGAQEKTRRFEELEQRSGQGGLSEDETNEFDTLKKDYRLAPWLMGMRVVPTEAFSTQGIEWEQVKPIEQRVFARPRRRSLFEGPLLLIKETVEGDTDRVPMFLVDQGIAYKHQVVGIHAPADQLDSLRRIQSVLESGKLLQFLLAAVSPKYLVNRSTAFESGALWKIPYSDSPGDLDLTPVETVLVDDVVTHSAEFKREGPSSTLMQQPTTEQLRGFSEWFCRVLGTVYGPLNASAPVVLNGAICCPFYIGAAPAESFAPDGANGSRLDALLHAKIGSAMRCQRIVRVLEGNWFMLVKPAQLRYWLRSVAVRDADELFVELQQRGY